jgi:hypothetical protein
MDLSADGSKLNDESNRQSQMGETKLALVYDKAKEGFQVNN